MHSGYVSPLTRRVDPYRTDGDDFLYISYLGENTFGSQWTRTRLAGYLPAVHVSGIRDCFAPPSPSHISTFPLPLSRTAVLCRRLHSPS